MLAGVVLSTAPGPSGRQRGPQLPVNVGTRAPGAVAADLGCRAGSARPADVARARRARGRGCGPGGRRRAARAVPGRRWIRPCLSPHSTAPTSGWSQPARSDSPARHRCPASGGAPLRPRQFETVTATTPTRKISNCSMRSLSDTRPAGVVVAEDDCSEQHARPHPGKRVGRRRAGGSGRMLTETRPRPARPGRKEVGKPGTRPPLESPARSRCRASRWASCPPRVSVANAWLFPGSGPVSFTCRTSRNRSSTSSDNRRNADRSHRWRGARPLAPPLTSTLGRRANDPVVAGSEAPSRTVMTEV